MNEIYSRAADEVSIQHNKYKQLHKQVKEQWYLMKVLNGHPQTTTLYSIKNSTI